MGAKSNRSSWMHKVTSLDQLASLVIHEIGKLFVLGEQLSVAWQQHGQNKVV